MGERLMATRTEGRLSAAFVRTVTEPGRYGDGRGGHGLALLVIPSGARCWVQRLVIHGKRRELGLGGYPMVTLSEARSKAFENRKLARAGGDPLALKRRAAVPTFAEAAEQVYAIHRPGWRNDKHAATWMASLRDYAYPRLGNRRVSDITTQDVMAVLLPVWHSKYETARRVRQRISTVMKWAIAEGHRADNSAGEVLTAVLPRKGNGVRHHRALPHKEVAGAIAAVRGSGAGMSTRLAFEFLVLTAARSGEVRFATWAEIDLDAYEWCIPGERMKTEREHRVPLCDRAVEVLEEAQVLQDRTGLVFPGARRGPLSDKILSSLMHELGIDAVPHGFRSSFREWAAECTNIPREVCEEALAHVNPNRVEAAYQRSDLFDKRRKLMDAWATYLENNGTSAAVVPLQS